MHDRARIIASSLYIGVFQIADIHVELISDYDDPLPLIRVLAAECW